MKPEESFVGQPIRSLQTMLRTIAQLEPNQPTPEADGVYSPKTAASVAAFQRRRGLNPTGVTDLNTWEHIVRDFDRARIETEPAQPVQVSIDTGRVYQPGEAHHILYLVQTMLLTISLLLEEIPAPDHSGVLDKQTEQALRAFQIQSGLKPTGTLDKQTWKALALQYALIFDELSRRLES